MLKNLFRLIVVLPFALVVAGFAVANRHSVAVYFDPFSAQGAGLSISIPLFILLFAALALGVVLGGVASWLAQGKNRRAARKTKASLARASAEMDRLKMQSQSAPSQGRSLQLTSGRN